MAFPGSNDILATTMERRSGRVQDEVLKNNAGLAWIKKRGNVKTISGGNEIVRELAFAENGNFGWYSGYDYLPASPQDMISVARFPLKQAACAVLMSGTEDLQNSGEAAVLDLMAERLKVTESTMQNKLSEARSEIDRVVASTPHFFDAADLKANICMAQGEHAEAQQGDQIGEQLLRIRVAAVVAAAGGGHPMREQQHHAAVRLGG